MASENSIDSPQKKSGKADQIDDAKFSELVEKILKEDREMLEAIGRL